MRNWKVYINQKWLTRINIWDSKKEKDLYLCCLCSHIRYSRSHSRTWLPAAQIYLQRATIISSRDAVHRRLLLTWRHFSGKLLPTMVLISQTVIQPTTPLSRILMISFKRWEIWNWKPKWIVFAWCLMVTSWKLKPVHMMRVPIVVTNDPRRLIDCWGEDWVSAAQIWSRVKEVDCRYACHQASDHGWAQGTWCHDAQSCWWLWRTIHAYCLLRSRFKSCILV